MVECCRITSCIHAFKESMFLVPLFYLPRLSKKDSDSTLLKAIGSMTWPTTPSLPRHAYLACVCC